MDQIFSKLDFQKIKDRIKRYALSNMGREKVENLSFFTDIERIENSLNILSEFKSLLELDEIFPIDGIKDIREPLARCSIENAFLQSKDFLNILSSIKTSRNIKNYLQKRKNKYPLLFNLSENLYSDKIVEHNIERAINENGEVKDDASKNLRDIRHRIISLTSQVTKVLDKILKRLSEQEFTQEDLITQRDNRFVIPIKVEHKRHVPGFIHSSSSSGATVFIEPAETLELNNELRSLQFEELREIEKILKELTNIIRDNLIRMKDTIRVLSEIDFIYAKAHYAIELIAYRPIVTEKGNIEIKSGYHPILLQKHKRDEIVPLNFRLGNRFNTIIITGPNAGGKSVTLKTIGILNIMLQCGLLIPASPDSEFRIFNKIFIDIGDEQSIENDLSTFSSHLLHLKEITEQADENTLILIDEIGEGTDPIEGGAIAASVLHTFTKKGAYSVATTHQSSLKVFAYQSDGIENGAMEFDQQTLAPTYRYKEGIPGSSYALEIAYRLGINKDILELAKEFIGEDKNKLENMIVNLENKIQDFTRETDSIKGERFNLKLLIAENKQKSDDLINEKKNLKKEAVKEVKLLLQEINSRIENTIKDIKERNADKESIKKSKIEVEKLKNEFSELQNKLLKNENYYADFKVGKTVKLKDTSEIGKIIDFNLDKSSVKVNFNKIDFEIPLEEVELVDEQEEFIYTSNSKSLAFMNNPEVKTELDLRGKYGAEAIPLIDKFLDEAYLHGLNRVDIIHGHGTGQLRKKVTEYLRKHELVNCFRFGEQSEGGTGVTIVEINKE